MGLYVGIFLVTLSGLMFEIGLTRIFSATIWYHFAFVAISVALLGWGLGGFALHLAARPHRLHARAGGAASRCLYGLSIPLALWLIVRAALPPGPAGLLLRRLARALLPRRHGALDAVRDRARQNAGRLYFADLLGASLGALCGDLPALLARRRERRPAVSLAPLVAAAAFFAELRLASAVAVALVLVLAAIGVNERTGLFKIHSAPTKGLYRHMAATPGLDDRADRLERLLAHRRGDRLRVARTSRGSTSTPTRGRTSSPGTASLESVARAARLVPRAALPGRAARSRRR